MGVLVFGWCPGRLIGGLLYFSLLILYIESQRILPIWNVFQGDFCIIRSAVWCENEGKRARSKERLKLMISHNQQMWQSRVLTIQLSCLIEWPCLAVAS